MGERTPLALIDAPASGRMAVGEAITNIAAAGDRRARRRQAVRQLDGARPAIRARTRRCTTPCARWRSTCASRSASSIPVGKDSMSMRTTWRDGGVRQAVTAPVSLIVSAFAPVRRRAPRADAAAAPRSRRHGARASRSSPTDAAASAARRWRRSTASSATRRPTSTIRRGSPHSSRSFSALHATAVLLAYHDIGDGGLFVTLREMAFASRCGLDIDARASTATRSPRCSPRSSGADRAGARGATQTTSSQAARDGGLAAIASSARPVAGDRVRIRVRRCASCSTSRASTCIARGRRRRTRCSACATIPQRADQEYARISTSDDPGPRRRS